MIELMQRLSKWSACYKASTVLSKTACRASSCSKVEQVQKEYENRIKHFLPRVGDHPDVTVQGMASDWDPNPKAVNQGKETQVPVDFPQETVKVYKD